MTLNALILSNSYLAAEVDERKLERKVYQGIFTTLLFAVKGVETIRLAPYNLPKCFVKKIRWWLFRNTGSQSVLLKAL